MKFLDLSTYVHKTQSNLNARFNKIFKHQAFIDGPEARILEDRLCSITDSKYAFCCANGTNALIASLLALDIKPGDEVIIPAFGFIAPLEACKILNTKVIFVDVGINDGNICINDLNLKVTKNTKAVIVMSLFGNMAKIKEIKNLFPDIFLIEDAAQSLGSSINNIKSCSVADISTTSFYPSKPIFSLGNGGCIFTQSEILATKIKAILNHGQTSKYNHTYLGLNGKINSFQAASILENLNYYELHLRKRNEIAKYYLNNIQNIKFVNKNNNFNHYSTWAQFCLKSKNRDTIINQLNKNKIPTAIHYPKPLYSQSFMNADKANTCKNSEQLCKEIFSIPLNPFLSSKEIDLITSSLNKITQEIAFPRQKNDLSI